MSIYRDPRTSSATSRYESLGDWRTRGATQGGVSIPQSTPAPQPTSYNTQPALGNQTTTSQPTSYNTQPVLNNQTPASQQQTPSYNTQPSSQPSSSSSQLSSDPYIYFSGQGPGSNYAGQTSPGYDPSKLPQIAIPSMQTWARMGPQFQQQYGGYKQAQTGATPEQSYWNIMSMAPPSGNYKGLRRVR